jgi:hypothetical protein
MAHDHAHAHAGDQAGYFTDQLCTIASCGILGAVCVLMYTQDRLGIILARPFHRPVLVGGIALIALAVVRGVALWAEAGRAAARQHDHDDHHHHDAACDHGGDCGHDHDHDHAYTPIKYAALLVPLFLFISDLPNEGFSPEHLARQMGNAALESPAGDIAAKGGQVLTLGFGELGEAAYLADKRSALEGRTIRVKGMFMPLGDDKQFTLFKIRMTCCAADAVPMQVRILSPSALTQFKTRDWVMAEGVLQFRKVVGKDKYIPVVTLNSSEDVRAIDAEPTEYDLT